MIENAALAAFANLAVTHLFYLERGPFGLIEKLRLRLAPPVETVEVVPPAPGCPTCSGGVRHTFTQGKSVFACPVCLSFWVTLALFLACLTPVRPVIAFLAAYGAWGFLSRRMA